MNEPLILAEYFVVFNKNIFIILLIQVYQEKDNDTYIKITKRIFSKFGKKTIINYQ